MCVAWLTASSAHTPRVRGSIPARVKHWACFLTSAAPIRLAVSRYLGVRQLLWDASWGQDLPKIWEMLCITRDFSMYCANDVCNSCIMYCRNKDYHYYYIYPSTEEQQWSVTIECIL